MNEAFPVTTILMEWFAHCQRPLPWRQSYDPYQIWISEIMLQQTQMDRVVPFFLRWMKRLPNPSAIISAPEETIYKLWEGLGYYSRVANIVKTARILCDQFDGQLPAERTLLLNLPGIGPYTADAIQSIAFNINTVVVDANVERFFARLLDIPTSPKEKENSIYIRKQAERLLPSGQARAFNQALMEFGALVCTPKQPMCETCPVAGFCEALQQGTVAARPVRGRAQYAVKINMATGILIQDGKIFIQKRLASDIWANLWEFPGGRMRPDENPADTVVREYLEETGFRVRVTDKLVTVRHSYTVYRVTLHAFCCQFAGPPSEPLLGAAQENRWVTLAELDNYAFPAGHRKLVDLMLANDLNLSTTTLTG